MTNTYQDFEVPEQLARETYDAVEKAKRKGKIRRGINEVTKAIERKNAKIVVIAEDVNPPEIIAHLPILAKEKGVPYIFVPSQKELGSASGIKLGTSSLAISNTGEAQKDIKKIIKKINKIKSDEEEDKTEEKQETKKDKPEKTEQAKETKKDKEEVEEEKSE